jgi:hypothetical protein
MLTSYVLTVNSLNPVNGVAIAATPVDNNGASGGSTSFTRSYNVGTSVTLTAPATSGSNPFVSWTGCTSSNSVSCTVVLTANTTVTANYTVPSVYMLTVKSTNPASGVSIEAAPADNNGKSAGTSSYTLNYYAGTSVTLTAPIMFGGNALSSWTGCTSSSAATCNVAINGNMTVTANYAAIGTYVLIVNSVSPSSGVAIAASPIDNNGSGGESTSFSLTYNSGTAVTLAAPATSGTYGFVAWNGCTSTNGTICNVTINSNAGVTATYSEPQITLVTVTPNISSLVIGTSQQFTATVAGTGSFSNGVTWSLTGASGSTASPGTLSASGLYVTPYPAPASAKITATSIQDSTKSTSLTVALTAPVTMAGPVLTVDTGNQTNAISPYIYGWNNYQLSTSAARAANITLDRFGGDATSRYNYLLDVTNSASDYYFENSVGATGQEATGQFNAQVQSDSGLGIRTLGTVDVLGWVAKDGTSCSFPVSANPNQHQIEPSRGCGDGENLNQTDITGNDPTVTSIAEGPSFAGDWVSYLVGKFGSAANGGVAIYDLDNEPPEWDAVHRDVHPLPFTYDELTNNEIATAKAIKAVDPTASVSGPVIDSWYNYFYSKKDVESGWSSGPCYKFWSNPVDRVAHSGIPLIEYYLQQFASYQAANNVRLLDYVDVHAYFEASYNGNAVGLTTAGDTGEQEARLSSTRVFWDPTYTDPNYTQPNYTTDSNYTSSCSTPLQAPQIIPMMEAWVKNDYPGTKTAITEYNFGGQESINGALAQADILGIFGSYGLDLGTLWGPPSPTSQVPGLVAFEIYRNYDGNNSTFGNEALASTSANQQELSVYGALRTSDNAVTVVVINKTYGDLTATLSLANLIATPGKTAQVFLYDNANIGGIAEQGAISVTPPASGQTTSTINTMFPAQSITLFVIQ